MDEATRQKRRKRHLSRVALSDPLQQEQGVKGLVDLALPEADEDGETLEALLQLLRPSGSKSGGLPSLAVARTVCQGLERLASEMSSSSSLDTRALVRKLLGTIEVTLTACSGSGAAGAVAAGVSKCGVQQQREEEALLSAYVGALASLSLQAVAQRQRSPPSMAGGGDGVDDDSDESERAEYLWCEQPPLAMALSLSPASMMRPVFEEASFFARTQLPCRPEAAGRTLVTVQCPLLVSVLLESRFAGLRDALVHALAAAPLDYLPQPALPALANAYLALLPFLPRDAGAESARLLEWARLVFLLVCHMDDGGDAARVGRRLVGRLMTLALTFQSQGVHLHLLAPLLVMLQRLADYDAALLAPQVPLLAFLLSLSTGGRERGLLLGILRAAISHAGDGSAGPAALRWCIFPLVVLTGAGGSEGAEAGTILALLEKRLASYSTSSSSSTLPSSSALHALLAASSAELLVPLQEAVGKLRAASHSTSKEWCLFLAMGVLFDDDNNPHIMGTTRAAALGLMERLVSEKLDKLAGPRLVPAVLYLLNRWRGRGGNGGGSASPELQYRLLALLPSLGRHQVGAQMVQALLQRLATAPLLDSSLAAALSGDKRKGDERLRVVLGSAALTLSAALFQRNTRTLPRLRDLLLRATSTAMTAAGLADRGASLASDEVDEHRLARALAVLEVVREDPEAGSEFVGLVQDYLRDPLPGVVAAAVDCITYLCTADCLDYWAAVRILQKKGRVHHQGHPLVLANLADLYGAAPVIFDCSALPPVPQDSTAAASTGEGEEEGEGRARLQEWQLSRLTDYLWILTEEADGGVRGRAYAALGGYVPLLLASEDAAVAQDLRDRLLGALQQEGSAKARAGLHEAVRAAVAAEADDSGTWRRTILGAGGTEMGGGGGGGGAGVGGEGAARAGPSRKTLRVLPTVSEVLALYRKRRDVPGLAGAALLALGGGNSGSGSSGSSRATSADEMLELFTDALSDEDGGGRCFLQRLLVPQSFCRFLPTLLAELAGAAAGGDAALAGTLQAVGMMEQTLQAVMDDETRRDGAANNALLALAALANALPPQLAHKVPGTVRALEGTLLSDAGASIALDVPGLMVSLGLAGRCLGAADAEAVHTLASRTLLGHVRDASFGGGSRTDVDACLWGSLVGAGALTDWARQIYSPDVATFRLLACVAHACLEVLAQGPLRGARAMPGLLREMDEDLEGGAFSVSGMQQRAARQPVSSVVGWETLAAQAAEAAAARDAVGTEGEEGKEGPAPLVVQGAAWGLALMAPNLAHVGLEHQLLQLFHVMRAAAAVGGPGVELALAAVAAQAVKGGLIGPKEVLAILRDGLGRLADGCDSAGKRERGLAAGQEGLMLGLAHLVVAVQGALSLPADVTDGLRRLLVARVKAGSGGSSSGSSSGSSDKHHQEDVQERAAALLALYTLLANGGPLVDLLGPSVGKGFAAERTTVATATELVAALRADLGSPSQRQRSMAARVMGLLVALREEEEEREETGGGGGGGGEREGAVAAAAGGGAVHRIDPASFGLPSEGTLLRQMLSELLRLVVEDGAELAAPVGRAFVVSTLRALGECGVLKFQHKQMALVLQNVLRTMLPRLSAATADDDDKDEDGSSTSSTTSPLGVIRACLAFAVQTAPRDQAYVTWLYDVSVNATPPVLEALIPHLPALVRLTPSGLLGQLLHTLWAKAVKASSPPASSPSANGSDHGFVYARLGRVLTGLARGIAALPSGGGGGGPSLTPSGVWKRGGAGARTGGARGCGAAGGASIDALWAFIQKDVLAFVLPATGGAFATDLSAWLSAYYSSEQPTAPAEGPCTPYAGVLEPLSTLLAALGRAKPTLDITAAIVPTSSPAALLLGSLLVGQGALALSALDSPRLALLGPASAASSPVPSLSLSSHALLLPFVVAAAWRAAAGAPSLQQQWLLALLDYLQVAPAQLAPLVVLLYLVTEWGAAPPHAPLGLALLREAPLRVKLTSLHRALLDLECNDGDEGNINISSSSSSSSIFFKELEARVRMDALNECAGQLLGSLEAAQPGAEVALLSRVVKIWAARPSYSSSQQRRQWLHATLLRLVEGATARPRRTGAGRSGYPQQQQSFGGFVSVGVNPVAELGVADQLPALKTLVSQWIIGRAAAEDV